MRRSSPIWLASTATALAIFTASGGVTAAERYPYQSCFEIAARMHDVPVDLLLAVAATESNWDPDARSNKNAHGIMQIQWPGTARHLGVRRVAELYNPCLNIELGSRYLRELLDANNGDVERALAAYNYGPGRIASSAQLPQGAIGYAAKVADKQERINGAAQTRQLSLRTNAAVVFDSRQHADRFARTLNKRIDGAAFAASRTKQGNYAVTMAVSSHGLSPTDVSTLETLGWSELGGR